VFFRRSVSRQCRASFRKWYLWGPFPDAIRSPARERIVIANGERLLGAVQFVHRLHFISSWKSFERRNSGTCHFLRRYRRYKHAAKRAIWQQTHRVTAAERLSQGLTGSKRKEKPLTKLDTTASLIVIDLQTGVVGLPTVHRYS
jgi:hypothetical protein